MYLSLHFEDYWSTRGANLYNLSKPCCATGISFQGHLIISRHRKNNYGWCSLFSHAHIWNQFQVIFSALNTPVCYESIEPCRERLRRHFSNANETISIEINVLPFILSRITATIFPRGTWQCITPKLLQCAPYEVLN